MTTETHDSGIELSTIEDRAGVTAVIDLATAAAGPHELVDGQVYAVTVPAGASVTVIDRDLDQYRDHPRRATGRFTVRTVASLVAYLEKHSLPETELWANQDTVSVQAVINAHQGTDSDAGWSDHRVTLQLKKTPAWLAWEGISGKLMSQVDFAEFIEQRTVDFTSPAGADVLELAQSFQAAKSGRFESSQRLSSGETTLVYVEDVTAAAGKKGNIAIPDIIELALIPFEGGDAYKVRARFRYRLDGGRLLLGVVLERPEDVLKDAFDQVVATIDASTQHPIFAGLTPS